MAKAGPAPKRVQGINSRVSDLKLRNSEKEIALELGVAELDATLTRTMFGASTVELEVFDPDRQLLKNLLLAEKWDAVLDGMHFRWPGALSKSGDNLTLTLEDKWIALLREKEGPKRATRGEGPSKMTRAEFIKRLVEEACGSNLRFYCPQLHKQQPIKSEKQAKDAKDEARENRGKGIGKVELTMDGAPVSATQREMGEKALAIAESFNAPFPVQVAVIEALMAESSLGTAAPGNVLEALEPYTRIRPAAEEISGFIAGEPTWTGVTALGYHKAHPDAAPHEIAQAVQKSGAGEASNGASNYGNFEAEARKWVEALGGGEGDASITIKEPYEFVVEKEQDYWSAIKELAKDVNWRVFIVGDVFYYMPEPELFRSEVREAIDGDTPWVENIDFEYDGVSPVTEIEIEALVSEWSPPPASVITLADYGPASIGFGDAPRADQKIGISDNRDATTGEGRARYLITSIEVPLTDEPAERMATIKARKPTAPLPEPANETKSVKGKGGIAAGGGVGGMGVYAGTAEEVVNQVIDYAHGHGFPAVTRESVRAANATHGPTIDGGRSDHQGPPDVAWAADISNGYETPEETALAAAVAKAFGIPWDGAGLVTHEANGYRLQLIYRTMEGGNHYNHVHFGCEVA